MGNRNSIDYDNNVNNKSEECLERVSEIQRNQKEFSCGICFGIIAIGDGIVLRRCSQTFCLRCLQNWIDRTSSGVVHCPDKGCSKQLEDWEISQIATPEIYKKYQNLCNRIAAGSTGIAVYCNTTDCLGWALCDDPRVKIFKCEACGKTNCLQCNGIHENMSCIDYRKTDEYARKLAMRTFEEESISKGESMRCPGCYIPIYRTAGCGLILCENCKLQICWFAKKRRWGPKGKGDTSVGCRCGVNGDKCADNCWLC